MDIDCPASWRNMGHMLWAGLLDSSKMDLSLASGWVFPPVTTGVPSSSSSDASY